MTDLTLGELIHRAKTIHTKIADDICPDGEAGRMTCRECDNTFEIEPSDVAHYLRHGWPRCCDRQMYWDQEPTP